MVCRKIAMLTNVISSAQQRKGNMHTEGLKVAKRSRQTNKGREGCKVAREWPSEEEKGV